MAEPDWAMAEAFIRHYFPGVGDPYALPLARFFRYYALCDRLASVNKAGGRTSEDLMMDAMESLSDKR